MLAEVGMGERAPDELADLDRTCTPAYIAGLRAEGLEGFDVSERDIERAHALQMLLFGGLTALPFEHLGLPPTPELHRVSHARAAVARFILERVRATE